MRYTDLIFDLYGTLVDIHTDEDAAVWEKTALYFGYYGANYTAVELKNAFSKAMPSRDMLDKMAVLYVITCNLSNEKNSVSIDDLLNASNNIGRVFNLNRVAINDYLDRLRIAGYLTINRTAGLDMVYVENVIKPQDIMAEYYTKAQVR